MFRDCLFNTFFFLQEFFYLQSQSFVALLIVRLRGKIISICTYAQLTEQ